MTEGGASYLTRTNA